MSLKRSAVIAFLATRDMAAAKEFYEGLLGLRLVSQEPFALVFDARGTMLRVTPVSDMKPAGHTVLGWDVADIRAEVHDLTGKGIKLELFDGLQQDEWGVWTSPSGARVAWFKDPDGNILSLTQFAEEGQR